MSGSTIYTWTTAANGDWTTSGDWSFAGYPDSSTATADISATGASYSIMLGGTDPLITVASLSITWSEANLDIDSAGGAETVVGDLVNDGNINLDNGYFGAGGSTLAIGGTLVNAGGVVIGGSALGAPTTLTAAALDNTGIFDVTATGETAADTASVLLAAAAGFGTAGTVTGQVNLDGNVLISFAGGGEIGTIASGAQLVLEDGVSVIDAGGTANSALSGLTLNAGELSVTGETLRLAGDFDNTGGIDVDNQFFGAGGSTLSLAGTLTNGGRITIGGNALGASTILAAAALDNTGAFKPHRHRRGLPLTRRRSCSPRRRGGFGSAGTLTGQVNLDGNVVISFAGGGTIGTIASGAQLALQSGASVSDAGGAANSALSGLTVNAGEISITGETLALAGALDNTGGIDVDNQFFGAGGSTLSLAGTLTNSGRITIGGDSPRCLDHPRCRGTRTTRASSTSPPLARLRPRSPMCCSPRPRASAPPAR